MATDTFPENPVTRLPRLSRALTCTAGEITCPATTLLGGTVNASWLTVPARILKPELVAPVSPVPAAVSV